MNLESSGAAAGGALWRTRRVLRRGIHEARRGPATLRGGLTARIAALDTRIDRTLPAGPKSLS